MKHTFSIFFITPLNVKFDFVDCCVRRVQPRISSLAGLLEMCYAFIGVVSGNFHTALAVKPNDRVCLLEKDFKLGCFTKLPIQTIDIKDYKDGSVLKVVNRFAENVKILLYIIKKSTSIQVCSFCEEINGY